jgi:hypothetical protein
LTDGREKGKTHTDGQKNKISDGTNTGKNNQGKRKEHTEKFVLQRNGATRAKLK